MTQDVRPFQEAMEQGVSANLCDALAQLTSSGNTNAVEVRIAWASTRRAPNAAWTQPIFRFSADTVPVLREVARILRDKEPYGAFELRGVVVRLSRSENETDGFIVVAGYVEGKEAKITVPLKGDDYTRAIEAHNTRQTIFCEGELIRDGRSYRLTNPRGFGVDSDS